MFDLKVINSVLSQFESERGIPREKALEAIEQALATAYKKEYGKRSQIIQANFDPETGATEFFRLKIAMDETTARAPDEERAGKDDDRVRFDPEKHIWLEDAQRIKRDAELGDEIIFPLEDKEEYGRISAQTAKQVIIQKIREAEKVSVYEEFEEKQNEIVSGTVQRVERGTVFVDLGRATGLLPYDEQIPGERFRQGQRVRAYLLDVDESRHGIFLRLSRSSPEFLAKLFALEAPEVASGVVEIKAIAREAGGRSKIAVASHDEYVDPVGACVGQRGVRVSTVMSELGREKIDIIEWAENPEHFVEEALSPAEILSVEIDTETNTAHALVMPDQQSLAIGKGGQNARLAAKLTGFKIDIASTEGDENDEELDETNSFDEADNDSEEMKSEAVNEAEGGEDIEDEKIEEKDGSDEVENESETEEEEKSNE